MTYRMKFELWEIQALGYWILGWLVSDRYPFWGTALMVYGTFCALGALYALFRSEREKDHAE